MKTILFSNINLSSKVLDLFMNEDTEGLISLLEIKNPEILSNLRANTLQQIIKNDPDYIRNLEAAFIESQLQQVLSSMSSFEFLLRDYYSDIPAQEIKFMSHALSVLDSDEKFSEFMKLTNSLCSAIYSNVGQSFSIYVEDGDIYLDTDHYSKFQEGYTKVRISLCMTKSFGTSESFTGFYFNSIGDQFLEFFNEN